jgi:hypothetical protein
MRFPAVGFGEDVGPSQVPGCSAFVSVASAAADTPLAAAAELAPAAAPVVAPSELLHPAAARAQAAMVAMDAETLLSFMFLLPGVRR